MSVNLQKKRFKILEGFKLTYFKLRLSIIFEKKKVLGNADKFALLFNRKN